MQMILARKGKVHNGSDAHVSPSLSKFWGPAGVAEASAPGAGLCNSGQTRSLAPPFTHPAAADPVPRPHRWRYCRGRGACVSPVTAPASSVLALPGSACKQEKKGLIGNFTVQCGNCPWEAPWGIGPGHRHSSVSWRTMRIWPACLLLEEHQDLALATAALSFSL